LVWQELLLLEVLEPVEGLLVLVLRYEQVVAQEGALFLFLRGELVTTLVVQEVFLLLMVKILMVAVQAVEVEVLTVLQRVSEVLLFLTAFQQVGSYMILQYQDLVDLVALEL
jgi:hypothetical protein